LAAPAAQNGFFWNWETFSTARSTPKSAHTNSVEQLKTDVKVAGSQSVPEIPRIVSTGSRNFNLLFSAIVLVALVFWLYGEVRTMQETVGFNGATTIKAVLFNFITLIVIANLLLFLSKILSVKLMRWWLILMLFSGSMILGSSMAEVWILLDETRFKNEILASPDMSIPQSRSRAWPNHGCTLVYIPTKGIHSTD